MARKWRDLGSCTGLRPKGSILQATMAAASSLTRQLDNRLVTEYCLICLGHKQACCSTLP